MEVCNGDFLYLGSDAVGFTQAFHAKFFPSTYEGKLAAV